ncbi:putative WD repeat-containing protein alr2800 [Planktothrix tepida]|uniref:WD repeat-containing protein alr2800 n=2 Tax=Planktothrix TaxID=54304 RepID=A0A9W4CQW6_9CYAN|nr:MULTISPECIES: tetratricopeptide repeat protein [Planktothrix]CAD5953449.1 putative WD repeat-containing protein alr2800 [Planktothrix tepida]CAD5957204.1 putative WD repeat-containing protein alr2800 [Planktothrix pseudagardhii]CUR32753.1 putative Histone acetyltransferase [Planktothrix tepida PCC 9214]
MYMNDYLKDKQAEFIHRLKNGLNSLLFYERPGIYGEIKTLSGQDLNPIRQHAWDMVRKYRKADPQVVFRNTMMGKLGEEIVKKYLGDFVGNINYEIIPETGDGLIDLRISTDYSIGIQVKTRYSSPTMAQWWVSWEEITKNQAIVCILIYSNSQTIVKFDEFKSEYSAIIAGFLPARLLQKRIEQKEISLEYYQNHSIVKLQINDLHYGDGLRNFLKGLTNNPDFYLESGLNCAEQQGDYQTAIKNYTKALQLQPTYADAYRYRGIAYFKIGQKQAAIDNLLDASDLYSKQGNIKAVQEINFMIRDVQKINEPLSTVEKWNCIQTLKLHSANIFCCTISTNGQILVTGSKDKTVKVLNPQTGELLHSFIGHHDHIYAVAISPNSSIIASGSCDNTIKLWNLQTGALIKTIKLNSHYITSLKFTPDGENLISGCWDYSVQLWKVATGENLRTLYKHSGGVDCVDMTSNWDFIVSGGRDRKVIIWDLRNMKICRTLIQRFYIRSLAISPDNQFIVTSSDDGKLFIWNLQKGQLIRTLNHHKNWVYTVAISPDGNRIVSGSADQTLNIWNLHTGELIESLNPQGGAIYSVTFITPDGHTFASSHGDGSIKIWKQS